MAGSSFFSGDFVEVSGKQEGFSGSYYEATVMKQLDRNVFQVAYKNLVQETDEEAPLVELVCGEEIRPVPPRTPPSVVVSGFSMGDVVDAFDNDGWWIGVIAGKKGKGSATYYDVYFETYGVTLAYHVSRVRLHLDWVNGRWKLFKNVKKCH